MKEVNQALMVLICISATFVVLFTFNPPAQELKFRYKPRLMSQEEKIIMDEKILVDKISKK